MKLISLLLVGSVLLGAHLLAIPLGVAQLSMYRVVLALSVAGWAYMKIIRSPKANLVIGENANISIYQGVYSFWLIYAIVSGIWALSLSRWIVGVFFVGCGVFSILFISQFMKEKTDIQKLFNVFFGMTVMHHVLAWIEVLFNKYFFADLSLLDKYREFDLGMSKRIPITTFGNQNDFATLILAGIFVGFILLKNSKSLRGKAMYLLYLLSGLFLLNQSGSRGNVLALLVGVMVYLVINIFDFPTYKTLFYLFFAGLSVFAFAVIFIPPFQDVMISIIEKLMQGPISPGASNRNRIHMILNGFYFLLVTFGFGVGAGNIEHWMYPYGPFEVDAPNIHNWFMDILAAYGLPVFVAYMGMYIYMLYRLFVYYQRGQDRWAKETSLVIFSYLIAFIISSLSSASNIIIEWQWIFFGIIVSFMQYIDHDEREVKNDLKGDRASETV